MFQLQPESVIQEKKPQTDMVSAVLELAAYSHSVTTEKRSLKERSPAL